jgi:N-acetylglutamate synthase-like GNAT family acetyltransferase
MNGMQFKIESLEHHPHHIPALAAWHHNQFGYLNPSVAIEQRIEKLAVSAQTGKLPFTLVALEDNCLIGAASLLPKTIIHPHLSPWLSSVYVAPEFRCKGIGSMLTQQVVAEAAKMGIDKMYLFTPNAEALYARLGWNVVDHAEHQGHRLTIMSIGTSPQSHE